MHIGARNPIPPRRKEKFVVMADLGMSMSPELLMEQPMHEPVARLRLARFVASSLP